MTQRWKLAGWLCIAVAVVLAVVSIVLALRGGTGLTAGPSVGIAIVPPPTLVRPAGLLVPVVLGVLAGVAFFTGLACFFWSAVTEARQQRAEIISSLERLGGRRQVGEEGA